ncbi:MAG: methyltransferase domain-containing protein [gamma proteobacterium symbiont of Clathrolucina costata]|nr:methyltransferase domain-containing protein [Candidatus Thiodiazotropha taylori]MBT3030280.1 methyltransferase domain-containing protein [Candidatus Thiodiazotropha sp. (ex Lucina pensylvanica)]MBT3037722.1 methyltransferase domain-containing protein [Candidatus Thiodiazotropha sp. (ex Codakia orbicularis)]MCG7863125.1 methyltransferase domain-containing protein [Candidatus Thiodiazotropha endolucinida]MBT3043041.1 methyltransferase domain-containing protein [Candidatus Thiodiazotropha sp. (
MCQPVNLPPVGQSEPNDQAAIFAEELLQILNHGAIALMISIGHRTGLFDTMARIPPSDSQGIAESAGLNERYVREWLGAMVTAAIVIYDADSGCYTLPPAHAGLLTRDASPDNVAVFAQYIPLLGQVEEEVIDCFYNGGGVPYERYTRFHEVMAEDSGQTVVSALFEHILPLIDGHLSRLERGIDVLDVGCGRGQALLQLARAFPKSRFTGYDFSQEAIEWARKEADRQGLNNLLFEVKDVATLDEQGAYDWIVTFDAIHDQKSPDMVLSAIHGALRDDGIYLMQDIKGSSHLHNNLEHPIGPLLYTLSTMHCMTVSLAQDGAGLGTVWGRELALKMLNEAGFNDVVVKELDHDFQNYFYIIRKMPGQVGDSLN